MIEIRRVEHASVQIRTDDQIIYIDPYYTDTFSEEVIRFYRDAEKADLLLITHHHGDHCDPETFGEILGEKTEIVAPEKCSEKIKGGFLTIEPEEKLKFADIEVKSVYAYNQERKRESGEPYHLKGEGVGYIIKINGKKIYHPGDTETIPEMEDIEGLDLSFIPIDGTYTMDVEEAVEAGKVIGADTVIPFHEKDTDPNKFKERLEKRTEIDVKILERGEVFELE